jgi:sigma-54 dependent transcriptional regulator, acetoin dehydrogenase operon transcriptional activator AcoR
MLTLAEPDLALWERFHSGRLDATDGPVHPVIAHWTRARSLGAAPEGALAPDAVLDSTALQDRRELVAPCFREIAGILDGVAEDLAARGYVLLVTDAEGVILAARGGGGFTDRAARVRLVEGARWHEATRGTNAIGTAIASGDAVTVIGRAHFEQPNHGLVCYAAPVASAAGETTMVLDITGPVEAADPLAQATLLGAARSVALLLRVHAYDRLLASSRALLERSLHRCPLPALLVEPPGVIRAVNARARADLGLLAAPGQPALALLGLGWDHLVELARSGAPAPGAHRGSALTLHAEPLFDDRGRALAVLVFVEPERAASIARPALRVPAGEAAFAGEPAFAAIIGDDPALVEVRARAARFARTSLPVLLLAETGTGKELMARAVHAASAGARGPFIALNCGAISASLLESELFGHAAFAFTGARPGGQEGKIAAAEGGTLFLDEIAEMPASLQALLLRVLEDGTYSRVGEARERRASFRLVCATCRDLPARVREGTFRQDLFYRLQGVTLTLPPLRARRDRLLLARALLARAARELGLAAAPELSPEAARVIEARPWPGNVRELKTALQHALVVADGAPVLLAEHLPADPMAVAGPIAPPVASASPASAPAVSERGASRFEAEGRALAEALGEARGNLAAAARRLGVARSTLYRMMGRHGVRAPSS